MLSTTRDSPKELPSLPPIPRSPVGAVRTTDQRSPRSDGTELIEKTTGRTGTSPGIRSIRHARLTAEPTPPIILPSQDEPTVVVPPPAVLGTEAVLTHERAQSRIRRAKVAAGVIEWLGSLAAVLLVVNAVLAVGGANPANGMVQFTGAIGPALVAPFADLFLPADPNLALVLNYGSAAAVWLLAATMLGRLVRKVAV
ncbi:hypothetical protein MOQ72_40305 [Saccharopolyspora sp. K220]|uniref:hypothetical protein n=1 Tax=Saccharopolyspora soli TaxID=2926618 RepID=UPI001F577E14|nr:hypothetical protein [Saccharopolyspora soli]MCI2423667.1 hypothetical protein [Saccharopolyspora soli]